jgi:hypothetical protein
MKGSELSKAGDGMAFSWFVDADRVPLPGPLSDLARGGRRRPDSRCTL